MSILNFPEDQYYHLIETATLCQLGSVSLAEALELRHVVLTLCKVGTRAGSERVRLKVFSDDGYSVLVATSDWVTISDVEAAISSTASQSWLARIRFDFPRVYLATTAYYAGLEAENYTLNGDVFFVGVKADWPDQINLGGHFAAQMRVIGYK